MKNLLTGILMLVSVQVLSGCAGSCSNMINDIARDAVKRDYVITLYANDGSIIICQEIKNTFIEISENGSGIRYTENGKLVMINGTYILEQK